WAPRARHSFPTRRSSDLAPLRFQRVRRPNVFVRGKPLGGKRPAWALSPRQSVSSSILRLKLRPDESTQERPSSALNTVTSDTPRSEEHTSELQSRENLVC